MREKALALLRTLEGRLGRRVLELSAAVHWGTDHFLRQLERIRAFEPRVVLEIGTHFGVSAALLRLVAPRVITIDLVGLPTAREVLETAEVSDVVPLVVADDGEKQMLLESLSFDLAFLDGDHSREGVELDFALTRKCGRVLFHDYEEIPNTAFPGVRGFVDAISEGAVTRDQPFAWWMAD
jgi:predicted O-methyltransferase YrrM